MTKKKNFDKIKIIKYLHYAGHINEYNDNIYNLCASLELNKTNFYENKKHFIKYLNSANNIDELINFNKTFIEYAAKNIIVVNNKDKYKLKKIILVEECRDDEFNNIMKFIEDNYKTTDNEKDYVSCKQMFKFYKKSHSNYNENLKEKSFKDIVISKIPFKERYLYYKLGKRHENTSVFTNIKVK